MDPEQLLWLKQFDEEADWMMTLANMTSALFIVGTNEERATRADQRQHRNCLRQAQLLLDPRHPWQVLRENHDNSAYHIATMGFNVQTFEYILESGFAERRNSQPVPRNDVPALAPRLSRPERRSLNATDALGHDHAHQSRNSPSRPALRLMKLTKCHENIHVYWLLPPRRAESLLVTTKLSRAGDKYAMCHGRDMIYAINRLK